MRNRGDRIGAMMYMTEKKGVGLLGYGIYEGDFFPPAEIEGASTGIPNPRLKLDDGTVVYGCECWWGPEAYVRSQIEQCGWPVIEVDIEDHRKVVAA